MCVLLAAAAARAQAAQPASEESAKRERVRMRAEPDLKKKTHVNAHFSIPFKCVTCSINVDGSCD